ncbi:Gfo/Idh/MocA family oxidoreductase [Streptomyces sp. XM4193]|uniref:Gfo/Idh/MocA family protein n=1 Tax=Streptomyces sp. XM4193 TaxID=2929782 RepID=UPI001FF8F6CB|nr:Gfo/Idh/MocA family oxidoreductase [Streptomyces sp. XM4193]MCK1798586.1 Gfo/Idh/MocA family oxidoreductase [Streptomyces sp. XM4193]
MSEPVRIAVLGAASEFARRRMLPAFAASHEVTLAAVASRDPDRAAQTAAEYGCRAFGSYPDLLEDEAVEAVYLPLPCALHARWARAALLAGKHVLVEKPVAMSGPEAAELSALARERGLALTENVLFVHHSQHRAALRYVTEGAIGRLQSFEATYTVPRRPRFDIRYQPALGGGALWDTGVYPVRAALHLAAPGHPLRLVGAVGRRGPGDTVDTSGSALLDGGDGLALQLTYGLDHSYRSSYTYQGSEGRLTVDRAYTPPADHLPEVRLERGGEVTRIPLAVDDQVDNAVTAFAEAVRTAAHPDPEVQRQAELLEEISRAASG